MDAALQARLARSANWFYWVSGLSLVNIFAARENFGFMLGSGAVEVAPQFGQTVAVVVDVVVIGGFALLGLLASKRHTWAFVVGMLLYAADGGLYVLAQDYLPALFHAFVLYVLFLGLQASMALNKLPADSRAIVMPHASAAADADPSRPA